MLGKRIINTGAAGAACTTDTVQILDGVPFQSIATYELDGDAESSVKTGYIGNAAEFNGSSSYIDTGISSLGPNFSVSLWINEVSLDSGGYFGNWNATSSDDMFWRTNTDGSIRISFDGGPTQSFGSAGDITVNNWHHIVVTFNNGTINVYADGNSKGSTTTPNTVFNSGANFYIGDDNSGTFFNGKIDQVRIFNKALSSSEVTTLYGETSASSTKSTTDIFGDSSGISLYELESNANDTSGTNNGTATNVVYGYDGTASNVTYSTGKFGQAGVFNGSSSYITLTQPVNLSTDNFTYSFWIYPTTNTGYGAPLAQYGNSTSTRNFYSYRVGSTEKITFGLVSTGAVFNQLISTGTTPLNQWSHVAMVRDSSTQKIYINGQLSGTLSNTTTTSTSSEPFLIGDTNDVVADEFFEGSIDQVRIYDKALSAADVTTLYNETAATASTNITLEAPSLVAYYKMNDATDETGSYDGTPTNVNFNVAGKFGNAGDFNGSSSRINLPSNPINGLSNVSFSFWIKPNDITSNQYVLSFINSVDGWNGVGIRISNTGKIQVVRANSGTVTTTENSTTTLSLNVWQHVAVSVQQSGTVIYIDGSSDGTFSNTPFTTNNTGSFDIGMNEYSSGVTQAFTDASIDQIRIFDRAITADEVTTLYNEVYCQPTIVPTDHFEPVIYTGNGGTQSISTLDFAPDFTWIKQRNDSTHWHILNDSLRGAGYRLFSNEVNAESYYNLNLQSFDSNGFTVGSDTDINENTGTYVAWNWKAGGDDVQNTDGTITSQVSANVDAGFSIVKFTASSNTNDTLGHGLSSAPEMIIYKKLDGTSNWTVYTNVIDGSWDYLRLNLTNAKADGSGTWSTASTIKNISTAGNWISYAFHSVDGMSKIGSYVGTNAAGNSIVTGFRPAFLMTKRSSAAGGGWNIFDNKRGTNKRLYPHLSNAEGTDSPEIVTFNSNGFTFNTADSWNNGAYTYIYMAFAEENVEPQPVLANSFNTVTYTGTGSTRAVTGFGFQPDLMWIKKRSSSTNAGNMWFDSVRGLDKVIGSDRTNAEYNGGGTGYMNSVDSDGFTLTGNLIVNESSQSFVAWAWKASNESTINQEGSITSIVSSNPASGFSVAKYTGNLTASTVGHGLSSTPELIIVKRTDSTSNWFVYSAPTGNTKYLNLDTTGAASTFNVWNNTSPTDAVFSLAAQGDVNASGGSYISYAFHSVDGYQKVGSYSGSGGAGNAQDVGFAPDFLMVKSTNAATNWAIFDTARTGKRLQADLSNSEGDDTRVTLTSTGFQFTGAAFNETGRDWIYLAIKAN